MLEFIQSHLIYWLSFMIILIGIYMVIVSSNLVKKIIGLSIMQSGIFVLYICFGFVLGGTAPILTGNSESVYSNPLPHVLILTAIVVGIATSAVGLALALRIYKAYGSLEEVDIELKINRESSAKEVLESNILRPLN